MQLAWLYKPAEPSDASTAPRFDFGGNIVPAGAAVEPHAGLHHHGESPQAAGYTLKELFLLARSTVAAQRVVALKVCTRTHTHTHTVLTLLADALCDPGQQ